MWNPLLTRCRVPADLATVSSRGAESDPRDVDASPAGIERTWAAVERLYRSGIHPAVQLCVRRRGAVILDRAIGHARGNGPDDAPDADKATLDTEMPFNIFSAAKAVTAMVIHLLDQRDALRLDDPVGDYIPGFAVGSKQWITIRHVLSHRAGIPNVPPEAMQLDQLADPEAIVRILSALKLRGRPGRQLAYHAITGGFILGELEKQRQVVHA